MKLNPIDEYGNCPVCKTSWDGGSILDTFIEQKKKGHWPKYTEADLEEMVKSSYSFPYRWSNLIGMENDSYDGVSHWMCPECECQFPRFLDEKE